MLEAGTHDPRELAEAARRVIVPDLLRRRNDLRLEPALFEPAFERDLAARWTGSGTEVAPSTVIALRERIEGYVSRTPRDRVAVICTGALRPVLADFLLHSGIHVGVYAYGELPNELALRPAEVITDPEPDALVTSA